jgi:uncharacterized tellurite resistance protein B-like protein
MVIHSNFADFVLFLYIHMSHVDNDYDPTEMKVIKEKMKRIFPEDVDLEKKLYTTLREYNAFDQSKMSELIKDTFAHFKSVKFSQKYKIYTDMYDIINADGKVDESETKALEALKQINEIGTEAKA